MKNWMSEMDELNTTGGTGGSYNTPRFTGEIDPEDIDDDFELIDTDEEEDENSKEDKLSVFKRYAYEIHLAEQTYKNFLNDKSVSDKRKLNKAVSNLNNQLQSIERVLDQNIKLRKDRNLGMGDIWKTTRNNVYKIERRLTRIQSKLMQLMS